MTLEYVIVNIKVKFSGEKEEFEVNIIKKNPSESDKTKLLKFVGNCMEEEDWKKS